MPANPPQYGESLGARERQVLEGMARGQSNGSIARELCLSVDTVKTYARAVFVKFGVRDRQAAVAAGFRTGLLRRECPTCGQPAGAGAQR
jgi:two-component system nitrate/nitrite response regulator NarL